MFRVVATGKNKNYGQFKEKRVLANSFIRTAIKREWIFPNIKYIGNGNEWWSLQTARRIAGDIEKERRIEGLE
jgi:hypothetical protein